MSPLPSRSAMIAELKMHLEAVQEGDKRRWPCRMAS